MSGHKSKTSDFRSNPDLPARERLVFAGSFLFAKAGFAGASVREICDMAGTSTNMIHHYFGSKQGLYDAILSQFSEHVFNVPIRIVSQAPDSRETLIARLEIFLDETLLALIENRDLYRLVTREMVVFEAFETYSQQFISYLEAAKAQGFVRSDLDVEMLTGLIIDRLGNQVLFAPWVQKTSGHCVITDETYRKRWLKANLDLFLHGILADKT